MVVYISAPENLNRLEDIRVNNLRRTGLVEGGPGSGRPDRHFVDELQHSRERGRQY